MKVTNNTLSDGTTWRLFEPDNAKPGWAVIWLQGFTSTIEGHADGVERMAEASGVTHAILDYAGHGNHPVALDDATRKQQFEEVVAVYDQLAELGYTNIIANGGSFGGYMAALLAAVRELKALVLRAPAVYADDEFELPFAQTRTGKNKQRKDAFRNRFAVDTPSAALDGVRNFDGPTYVVEHELDEVINPAIPKAYAAVAQNPSYTVVHGLKHSVKFMPNAPKYMKEIEDLCVSITIDVITANLDN